MPMRGCYAKVRGWKVLGKDFRNLSCVDSIGFMSVLADLTPNNISSSHARGAAC